MQAGLPLPLAPPSAPAVDDELAALKKGLISGSKQPVALPAGRPLKDALDLELEELRRKARE